MDLGEREYIPRQGSGEFSQQRDFRLQASQGDYRRQATQEDYRKQVPPDGDDVLMEWREGRQRVVETKREPGDDVRYVFSFLLFFPSFWILSAFISDSFAGCLSCPVSPILPLGVWFPCVVIFSFLPLHIPYTLFSRILLVGPDTDLTSPYRSKSRSWTMTQRPPGGQGAKPPVCTISNTALARS